MPEQEASFSEKVERLRTLLKADTEPDADDKGGKDDDDEDDKYDAEYMKKYMHKYMKENKGELEKMAKEAGVLKKSAEASGEGLDGPDAQAADGGGVILYDGTNNLKSLIKAVVDLAVKVGENSQDMVLLKAANIKTYQMLEGIGAVVAGNDDSAVVPAPKGQQHAAPVVPGPESGSQLLQKAQAMGVHKIMDALMKANKAGDVQAGLLVTALESCNGQIGALPQEYQTGLDRILSAVAA